MSLPDANRSFVVHNGTLVAAESTVLSGPRRTTAAKRASGRPTVQTTAAPDTAPKAMYQGIRRILWRSLWTPARERFMGSDRKTSRGGAKLWWVANHGARKKQFFHQPEPTSQHGLTTGRRPTGKVCGDVRLPRCAAPGALLRRLPPTRLHPALHRVSAEARGHYATPEKAISAQVMSRRFSVCASMRL
jgi:hypothetical protein